MPSRFRLLLVDDHRMLLEGLRLALQAKYEVVGLLENGAALVQECRRLAPDAVLLDLSLPGISGLELIPVLRRHFPEIKILILTMYTDRVLADAALQSGAHGFMPKDADTKDLCHAIAEILAGRVFVSPRIPKHGSAWKANEPRFGLNKLTPRQRQIVTMLGEGKSTARIAAELQLTSSGVTFHRTRIRKVLGIDSEWGLLRYALVTRMSLEDERAEGGRTDPKGTSRNNRPLPVSGDPRTGR
jgi:DNA-binding NarL/FixJ family response regulator